MRAEGLSQSILTAVLLQQERATSGCGRIAGEHNGRLSQRNVRIRQQGSQLLVVNFLRHYCPLPSFGTLSLRLKS